MAQTSRISQKSDRIIQEMVKATGKSKIEVIELALETYRRCERMKAMNEAYENLKNDPEQWNDELKERNELEGTIADGFEED